MLTMSRVDTNKRKLTVLELIKSKKDILFASIHNKDVTKEQKENAWQEVLEEAQAVGLASKNRIWIYARDGLFALWKRRALAKRDNMINGADGSKSTVIDEVDHAILDILGYDSAAVESLVDMPETSPPKSVRNEPIRKTLPLPIRSCKRTRPNEVPTFTLRRRIPDEMENLKKELMEVEIYKNKLQIMKLERELELPPSKYSVNLGKNASSDSLDLNNETDDVDSD